MQGIPTKVCNLLNTAAVAMCLYTIVCQLFFEFLFTQGIYSGNVPKDNTSLAERLDEVCFVNDTASLTVLFLRDLDSLFRLLLKSDSVFAIWILVLDNMLISES